MLRRDQENEAQLQYKLRDQKLLQSEQNLIDTQKSLAPYNSLEQMLMDKRNEEKRNREISKDRLEFNLKERKQLKQIGRLPAEPPIF